MTRRLSQAVVGDIFRIDNNLRDNRALRTGFIVVEHVNGPMNMIIREYNINGVPGNRSTNTQLTPLTDENTAYVDNRGDGPVAMAAGRRRRKSRRSRRSRKSRRRR